MRPSPRGSAIEQRGSIGVPEVRWLTKRFVTVTSASASAASMSPPDTPHSWVLLVPKLSHTSGAPSSSAASGSTTAGFGSYSTITSSAASTAAPRLAATTTATGSPTCLTSPRLSGQWSGLLTSTPGGFHTDASGPAKSPAISSPVKHRHDARVLLGRRRVDRDDVGMRLGRPDDHRVQHPREVVMSSV